MFRNDRESREKVGQRDTYTWGLVDGSDFMVRTQIAYMCIGYILILTLLACPLRIDFTASTCPECLSTCLTSDPFTHLPQHACQSI